MVPVESCIARQNTGTQCLWMQIQSQIVRPIVDCLVKPILLHGWNVHILYDVSIDAAMLPSVLAYLSCVHLTVQILDVFVACYARLPYRIHRTQPDQFVCC